MFLLVAGLMMPVLLVFGLYHLMTWFNFMDLNSRDFWKRVGVASAISHVILSLGFFAFSYLDYNMNLKTTFEGLGFDNYLFQRSEFWTLMTFFDTAPMLALLGIFSILAKLEINPPILVGLTIVVTLLVGTVQWFFVGGGIGVIVNRFWSGLKTPDDVDEDWM